MAGFTETARIVFKAETREIENAMRKLEIRTKRLQDQSRAGMKSGLRLIAATAASTTGLIGLYAKQEQSERHVQRALKHMGKEATISAAHLQKVASAFQEMTTYDDDVALGLLNMGLRMANLTRKQLPGFLELSADIAEVLRLDLYNAAKLMSKVLSDPGRNLTQLTRYGIQFTDAQIEMVRAMQTSGKFIEAQDFIIEGLTRKFGGAARSASQVTGQLRKFKNDLIDLGEQIGKWQFRTLEPMIQALSRLFVSLQRSSFPKAAEQALRFALALGVVKVAMNALRFGWATVALGAVKLARAFRSARYAALLFSRAVRSVLKGTVFGILTTLVAFAPEIYRNWKVLGDGLEEILFQIASHWEDLMDNIQMKWNEMKAWLQDATGGAIQFHGGDWDLDEENAKLRENIKLRKRQRETSDEILNNAFYKLWKDPDNDLGLEDEQLDPEAEKKALAKAAADRAKQAALARRIKNEDLMMALQKGRDELELNQMFMDGKTQQEIQHRSKVLEAERELQRARIMVMRSTTDQEREEWEQRIEIAKSNLLILGEQFKTWKQEQDEENEGYGLFGWSEDDLSLLKKRYDWVDKMEKDRLKRKKQRDKEELALERAKQEGIRGVISETFNLAGKLLGKNKGAQKALALAELGINTYLNAQRAMAINMATYPAPAGQAIGAAAAKWIYIKGAIAAAGIMAAQKGGMIPGSYTPYDSRLVMAQPGEHIVPVGRSWEQVRRGIIRDADANGELGSGGGSQPVEVVVELAGDAGDLFRTADARDRALRGV